VAKAVRWTEDDLKEFVKRGQAAQRAVEVDVDRGTARLAPARRQRAHGKTTAAERIVKASELNAQMAAARAGPRKESKLEQRFDQQLTVSGLPAPIKNYFYLPGRDLEIDRAWPQWKLGVEINGGAHRASMANLARDCEKICLGLLAGWWILPFSRELIRSERALELLQAAITQRTNRKRRGNDR
jgi:very-short-patch-repair endonuclease